MYFSQNNSVRNGEILTKHTTRGQENVINGYAWQWPVVLNNISPAALDDELVQTIGQRLVEPLPWHVLVVGGTDNADYNFTKTLKLVVHDETGNKAARCTLFSYPTR